ncbi:glycoside hydrolase family 36 protein [Bifidobacterium sp. ESL0732]|uniref:glycoside hydrolase family 36 protein n=1 Tax=Bifidobacterium sp. ESL0732 TaxID=2983222 RepID=UPI0023F771DF|nr:glycoside hydrolase family 36 protein [Bifidobacterium sp. ESL0732]WEV63735.1 alpha-galactosidase [Bifidobacterium sp. ESL0732]
MEEFSWSNNCITLYFQWDEHSPVSLARVVGQNVDIRCAHNVPLVEILIAGTGHWIANDRLTSTTVGRGMRYRSHHKRKIGDRNIAALDIVMTNDEVGLQATVTFELPENVPMFCTFVKVKNLNSAPVSLESVTSWASEFGAVAGHAPDLGAWCLHEARYDWLAEGRWRSTNVRDLLPDFSQNLTGQNPRSEHKVVSTGTWSTGKHAPLAYVQSEDFKATWLFQIEHNGPWRWEIGDDTSDGYIALSGPTNVDHGWSKMLKPGESFTSVPVSVAPADTFETAYASLVAYRRFMRQPNEDNVRPRVIFNDYMNTINGDPTTAKLLPLISAAGKAGTEIFCVDCGWYDDTGDWWPSVGEWKPSKTRFPNGIQEVFDAIRYAGMIPGLWLEPEVIGVKSPMTHRLPDSAFFQRNGHRLVEQDRYVLDLRDASARAHLDEVVDRLIEDYGIGYFKFDYNVSPGSGTDFQADSAGDGLLGHNRAYSAWIESIYKRHPGVILENCSSGGMREDFAQTGRFQVQSTSDQQDFRIYPTIAATATMMVLPEQAANWAYPSAGMSDEEVAFNLNTTMLGRFFLSGYLNRMASAQFDLCSQAIDVYKHEVQPMIGSALPFWPLGLPEFDAPIVAYGLETEDYSLVTLWARNIDEQHPTIRLAIPKYRGRDVDITPVFPIGQRFREWQMSWNRYLAECVIDLPEGEYASRTFKVMPKG